MDQEIVDFVMAELSYGDCARNSLAVTNFQSQVVAGLRYKFDLEAVASAQCGDGAAESCHVEVSIDYYTQKQEDNMHDTNIVNRFTPCRGEEPRRSSGMPPPAPGQSEEMEERRPSGHWPPTQLF